MWAGDTGDSFFRCTFAQAGDMGDSFFRCTFAQAGTRETASFAARLPRQGHELGLSHGSIVNPAT